MLAGWPADTRALVEQPIDAHGGLAAWQAARRIEPAPGGRPFFGRPVAARVLKVDFGRVSVR